MLLAAFGDIAGNWPAFRAVLDAVDAEGIQTLVNTGDSVGRYPWPGEVVTALSSRRITSVQGFLDRHIGQCIRKQSTMKADEWVRAAYNILSSDQVEFLLGLPKRKTFTVDGVQIFMSADSPDEADSEAKFSRIREGANAEILICGHAETPFVRQVGGALFVNPGSVCGEVGVARYAIIDTETTPWHAKLCQVSYAALSGCS